MSELSKFINLVIEYGQKLQSTINKKYRPFIRSLCNLQQLAKSTDPQHIVLTRQIIIFKLGLQAKSTKAIQLSLYYLQKFLSSKFINLTLPNYCEQFQIDQTTIRKKQNANIKGQMRTQLMRLLQPLVHFKSTQINLLLFKVYEYLITQPIAPMLIELNLLTPNTEIGQKILYNYYSYRFYIYEEVRTFTQQKQFKSINPLCIRNQKINAEIQQALVNHEELLDLVHKYVGEIVVQVAGVGGKYGLCVICKQPADYYCKVTKASLCGADCKKRHLQLAEKQYKMHYQSIHLWQQIHQSFQLLLSSLSKKQSKSLLTVFVTLLQKPNLFMLVKQQFRQLITKYTTGIVNMTLNYKDQQCFQLTYNMIGAMCRYWMVEAISSVEYFFKQCALKLIQDKRPSFKLLIGLFKALAKIFQYGKTTIELYINFVCQFKRTNILQRILFQLSKMCQDKFSSTIMYNKHEKIAIKNGAFTLINILCKGLNEYRIMYPEQLPQIEEQILQLKQKKTSLQKFAHKFNQHWSQGLKLLFNMNLVGLDSEVQIVDILRTIKGLKKQKIQQMLLSHNSKQYMPVLFNKLIHAGPFMGMVELFRLIPLKKSSLLLKHYSDFLLGKMITSLKDQNNSSEQYSVTKWITFLTSTYTLKDLQRYLYMEGIKVEGSTQHVYMKCLQTKGQLTMGTHKTYFRHCISRSYIKIIQPQLSLLQIPILFLLQTSYPHDKIFEIISQLVQICAHASWIVLCLKCVDLEGMIRAISGASNTSSKKYTMQDHSLVMGCLKQCKSHGDFIHQWQQILQFINKLYKLITLQPSKKLTFQSTTQTIILEQPLKTRQQLSILQLQQYLLMIGDSCVENFPNYIIAMIKIAQQELQRENVFFLQKMFQILQRNLDKFVDNMDGVMGEFACMLKRIVGHNLGLLEKERQLNKGDKQSTVRINKSILSFMKIQQSNPAIKPPPGPYSSEIMIYIADMLKQLFVKILKHLPTAKQTNQQPQQAPSSQSSQNHQTPNRLLLNKNFYQKIDKHQYDNMMIINSSTNSSRKIQQTFFRLLELILQCENRQASDFVMNSISMVIMVHSNLCEQTWSIIIEEILKQHCKQYRQQALTILQKILKDKLNNCPNLEFELINLAIDLVHQKQVKLSIQSIHLMKDFIDLMIEQCEAKQKIQSKRRRIYDGMSRKQGEKLQEEMGQQEELEQSRLSSQMSSSQSEQGDWMMANSPKKIKQYLLLIIYNLIEFITYECHQAAIEVLFILMKTKLPRGTLRESDNNNTNNNNNNTNDIKQQSQQKQSQQLLFSPQQITFITNSIFKKLQSLPKELLSRGEKIMNESLFWSVRNNNFMIVKNLEECIVNKFERMSYTAMKCIKTFVSMTNPKNPQDWDPIQQTLVNILSHTHLTNVLQSGNPQVMHINIQQHILNNMPLSFQHETKLSLTELSNKLIIQRMAVQVLPNDVKIISQLTKIYTETLEFNDNIYLRCLLWRQGLGKGGDSLPDILSLEELISYRIISTYYWSKQYEKIADFTLNILHRYCQASQKWQYLQSQSQRLQQSSSGQSYQVFILCKDYWRRRRQPLKVIINYMLPKLPKICRDYSEKEKLLHGIIQGMKFSEESGQYIETIRQMAMVR